MQSDGKKQPLEPSPSFQMYTFNDLLITNHTIRYSIIEYYDQSFLSSLMSYNFSKKPHHHHHQYYIVLLFFFLLQQMTFCECVGEAFEIISQV